MTYQLIIDGITCAYTDEDEFTDAVRDALDEWVQDADCSEWGDTEHICCANHPTSRFNLCATCKAVEQAAEDDSAWMFGNIEMPYEIRLPGRHIQALEV